MAADNQWAIGFILSRGEASDAYTGRFLLDTIGRKSNPDEDRPLLLLLDRAYEAGETRRLAFEWGYSPVVPPQKAHASVKP
ncbi:MAG: hypothetical protein LBP88_05640 [Treponema sp.]|nr:hypothetical protein [Treponema sp.]